LAFGYVKSIGCRDLINVTVAVAVKVDVQRLGDRRL